METLLIYGLIAAIGSVLGSTISSITNGVSTKQTNEANKQIAEEANAAQAAESEKAYRRSMPTNQVSNLRAAGMSHAGALNVLSGGGSYTPAPVNTAQMQSFSMDNPLAGAADIVAGIGSNSAQMKQNKEQFEKGIQETERSNKVYESIAQQQADTERSKVDNENMLRTQEFYINEYNHGMHILRDNVDLMKEYEDVSHLVDPVKYKSAFEYVEAVLKKSGRNELSAVVRDQLENKWTIANSDKFTSAQTGKTNAETKTLNEQFKQLKQEVEEYLSEPNKQARANDVQAQNDEAILRSMMAEYDIDEEEVKRMYYYDIQEDGTYKPNGWRKGIEKADRFWNATFEIFGVNRLARALGAVLKVGITKKP